MDSNFHFIDPYKRLSDDYSCKPIHIGNNVFIGCNVILLSGITIGDNSVVGAGCIIDFDITDNIIVKINANNHNITKIIKNLDTCFF